MKTIVGLLLAAGSSRRFGSNKLLHPLPDGEFIITSCVRNLITAVDHLIVLVRPQQVALCELLSPLGVELVEVDNADAGMSVSLAAGVRAAPHADAWVVALADMPRVSSVTARQVVQALRQGASIAAPYHAGRRGHPVGFAHTWYVTLTALKGDEGARSLLRQHSATIKRVDVNDAGCLFDVDTPDDLTLPHMK